MRSRGRRARQWRCRRQALRPRRLRGGAPDDERQTRDVLSQAGRSRRLGFSRDRAEAVGMVVRSRSATLRRELVKAEVYSPTIRACTLGSCESAFRTLAPNITHLCLVVWLCAGTSTVAGEPAFGTGSGSSGDSTQNGSTSGDTSTSGSTPSGSTSAGKPAESGASTSGKSTGVTTGSSTTSGPASGNATGSASGGASG